MWKRIAKRQSVLSRQFQRRAGRKAIPRVAMGYNITAIQQKASLTPRSDATLDFVALSEVSDICLSDAQLAHQYIRPSSSAGLSAPWAFPYVSYLLGTLLRHRHSQFGSESYMKYTSHFPSLDELFRRLPWLSQEGDEVRVSSSQGHAVPVYVSSLQRSPTTEWHSILQRWVKEVERTMSLENIEPGRNHAERTPHKKTTLMLLDTREIFEKGFLSHPSMDAHESFLPAHQELERCLMKYLTKIQQCLCSVHNACLATFYRENGGSLMGERFLLKCRVLYLRQQKFQLYWTMMERVVAAELQIRSQVSKISSVTIPLFGDDFLGFLVALPGRRQCQNLGRSGQWKTACRLLSMVYPLMQNPRAALQNVLEIGLFGGAFSISKAKCLISVAEIVGEGFEQKITKKAFMFSDGDVSLSALLGQLVSVAAAVGLFYLKTVRFHPEESQQVIHMLSVATKLLQFAAMSHDENAVSSLQSMLHILEATSSNSLIIQNDKTIKETFLFIEKVIHQGMKYMKDVVFQAVYRIGSMQQLFDWGAKSLQELRLQQDPDSALRIQAHWIPSLWNSLVSELGEIEACWAVGLPSDVRPRGVHLQWNCGCGSTNPLSSPMCWHCSFVQGGARDSKINAQANRALTPCYQCVQCGSPQLVTEHVKHCGSCGSAHPRRHALREAQLWYCATCQTIMKDDCPCSGCQTQDPEALTECVHCLKQRPIGALFCPYCGDSATTSNDLFLLWRCCQCEGMNILKANHEEHGKKESVLCRHCLHQNRRTVFDQNHCPSFHYFTWRCDCGARNSPVRATCWSCCSHHCRYTCPSCHRQNSKLKRRSVSHYGFMQRVISCSQCGQIHPREEEMLLPRLMQCPACWKLNLLARSSSSSSGQKCQHCSVAFPSFVTLFVDMPWTCHACGTSHLLHQNLKSIGGEIQDLMVCASCGTDRMDPALFNEYAPWQCHACQATDQNNKMVVSQRGFSCQRCYSLHPAVPIREVFVWRCENRNCRTPNPSWSRTCCWCGQERTATCSVTGEDKVSSSSFFIYQPWECAQCGCRNSALALEKCGNCKKKRPPVVCSSCHESHQSYDCSPEALQRRLDALEATILNSMSSGEIQDSAFSFHVSDEALLTQVREFFTWQPTECQARENALLQTPPLLMIS